MLHVLLRSLDAARNRSGHVAKALLEALLYARLDLADEALLRSGDHTANHMATDCPPKTARNVAAVAARLTAEVLLEKLGLRVVRGLGDLLGHFVTEAVKGLACVLNDRAVPALSLRHV